MEAMLLEAGRAHPRRHERRSIRRKAPTSEQAGPAIHAQPAAELRRECQTYTGQQSLPAALLKHGQGGSLIEMTCEYSSELQEREIVLFEPARWWTSLKLVSLPKVSWTGGYVNHIGVQGARAGGLCPRS